MEKAGKKAEEGELHDLKSGYYLLVSLDVNTREKKRKKAQSLMADWARLKALFLLIQIERREMLVDAQQHREKIDWVIEPQNKYVCPFSALMFRSADLDTVSPQLVVSVPVVWFVALWMFLLARIDSRFKTNWDS